ncbi:uncharacterized protein CELE_F25H5.10 [Caenorhabditis elegans]|uniref:Uncharacterized protein n=1 Tax=Caenorhabditis elegans TaxID=6239 RepID=B3WFX2_CAEEL|nr:Uncharacterized protein CELE_F25H5.10 [Caenorhabditis elegans]CAQ76472.1 Uncharacterized protein CELE_F25H5.10 [Caenorhabditis elegans]|eukprot:NP_001129767.1 Uncharacterized protein CELE_F25H5.10 [Caenorhabditis elegans]
MQPSTSNHNDPYATQFEDGNFTNWGEAEISDRKKFFDSVLADRAQKNHEEEQKKKLAKKRK